LDGVQAQFAPQPPKKPPMTPPLLRERIRKGDRILNASLQQSLNPFVVYQATSNKKQAYCCQTCFKFLQCHNSSIYPILIRIPILYTYTHTHTYTLYLYQYLYSILIRIPIPIPYTYTNTYTLYLYFLPFSPCTLVK
jgi:hypothetical protein